MDCGVFLKAPQGLVGSPCNALILLPHSLPTSPTHPPTTRSPAMAPHTLHWDAADAKWTTIQQESVASLADSQFCISPLYQAYFQTASTSAFSWSVRLFFYIS